MKISFLKWLFLHRFFGSILSFIFGNKGIALIFPVANVIRSPQLTNIGNDVLGHDILYGSMYLAGIKKPIEEIKIPGDTAWHIELYKFKWLLDLKEVDTSPSSKKANEIIESMIAWYPLSNKDFWKPEYNSIRIINILSSYDFLKNEMLLWQKKKIDQFLAFSSAYLIYTQKKVNVNNEVDVLKALIFISCSIEGYDNNFSYYIKSLEKSLNKQILSDGCHTSRNGQKMVSIVADLIDIQNILNDIKYNVPVFLRNYIDKLAVAIRSLRHPDGGLCVFNGTLEGDRNNIDKIMLLSKMVSKPLLRMPYGGYDRVQVGNVFIIIDTQGKIKTNNGYDSKMALELSYGKSRIFSSVGGWSDNGDMEKKVRERKMFSTLLIFGENKKVMESKFAEIKSEHKSTQTIHMLSVQSSIFSYAKLQYARTISINKDGTQVLGEELVGISNGANFKALCVRFHLHPSAILESFVDSRKVLIRSFEKILLEFSSNNGKITTGESYYTGIEGDIRKTNYIDIWLESSKSSIKNEWLLKQV